MALMTLLLLYYLVCELSIVETYTNLTEYFGINMIADKPFSLNQFLSLKAD